MDAGGQSSRYLPALDGLRALAVAAVLLFHADIGLAGGGFLGVSTFFTLSGFLITTLLIAEHGRAGRISLRGFYGRRARRLIPAAYLCVAAVLALGFVWNASQRQHLPGDAIAAVANVANWRFAFASHSYLDLFLGAPSPLAHFWSLAIEEQCYLILPLVVAFALRRGRRRLALVLGTLVVASLVATLLTHDLNVVYNGTHTRSGELLVGALAAVLVSWRPLGRRAQVVSAAVGLTVLAVCAVTTDLHTHWLYRGGFLAVSLASAAAVVGLAGDHALARVVGNRWLVAIGRVSYGIYLFHWPVFLILTKDRLHWPTAALLAARLAVTTVVTLASYRFLERPVRLRQLLVGRRPALVVLSVAVATLVVGALVVVPAPRFNDTQQLLALGTSNTVNFASPSTTLAGAATTVAPATPTVLVVGNDHTPAGALAGRGWRIVDAVQSYCPAAASVEVRTYNGNEYDTTGCAPGRVAWTRSIGDEHPSMVVVSIGPIELGLVRRVRDAGYPAATDVVGIAARLRAAEDERAAAIGAVQRAGVPFVIFDGTGDVGRASTSIDRVALALVPPPPVVRRVADLGATVDRLLRRVGGAAATRLLVIGDSTSIDMAKALHDASDGALDVLWAGANGCPIVRATALRPLHAMAWQPSSCAPFDRKLPPLLQRFRPQAILLVEGPTELQEQQYPGDPGAHVAGDVAFTAFHDSEMAALRRVTGDVPLLVADSPAIHSGQWATSEMVTSGRVDAWNAQVRRWVDSSSTISIFPYALPLVAYEAQHGSIRSDGVHPDVGPLTDLARHTLLPSLRQLLAPRPRRLLVIGDSTSLMVAKALNDAAGGTLVVQWAGQEGCPLVQVDAVRGARHESWMSLTKCRDVPSTLPSTLEAFHPDAVLLVLGAMELMEQHYPSDPPGSAGHLVGDAVYVQHHDEQVRRLMAVIDAHHLPLYVADTPPLGVGRLSSFDMADPARASSFNSLVAAWHGRYPSLTVFAYAESLVSYERLHGGIRPDGSHPLLAPLTDIARATLLPELRRMLATQR
ncbi:MAG: acyltransferase [Actinomycetota bacterium]